MTMPIRGQRWYASTQVELFLLCDFGEHVRVRFGRGHYGDKTCWIIQEPLYEARWVGMLERLADGRLVELTSAPNVTAWDKSKVHFFEEGP